MIRASANIMSFSAFSWRLSSKLLYLVLSFDTPMTFDILFPSSVGNEGCAMTSLKVLCGSAVMRHIEASGEVLRECGRGILLGFRRFCETMCFLVVRTSHIGSASSRGGVDEGEESAKRDFLFEEAAVD